MSTATYTVQTASDVSMVTDDNNIHRDVEDKGLPPVTDADGHPTGHIETAVYSRRWPILVIFSFTLLVNQIQYCAFATINQETITYFNSDNLGVTMLTAVYSAVYVLFILPMCLFYDKLGFYDGMLLTGVTNVLCGGFKFIGAFSPHYAWLFVGQFFGGFAQLCSLSIPPLLAAIWFPLEERSLACSIGTLSGFLGIAYSFYFSPVIIDNQPTEKRFIALMGSHFGAAALVFVLALLIIKDKPLKPPSVTARVGTGMPPTVRGSLKLFWSQLTNFSLMRLWMGFGLANGTVTALSTVLSTMLLPYNISEGKTGAIISVAILAGCIAAPVIALTLDKYRNYKSMLVGLYFFSTLTIVGAALVITFDIENLYGAAFALIVLNQVTLLPAIPVAMEFSVEKTYPTPEVVGSSLCLVHLCIYAVIGSVMFSSILGDNSTKDEAVICIWICVGVVVTALGLSATVRNDRFRYDHEQELAANSMDAPIAQE